MLHSNLDVCYKTNQHRLWFRFGIIIVLVYGFCNFAGGELHTEAV